MIVKHRQGQYSIRFVDSGQVAEGLSEDCFVITDANVSESLSGWFSGLPRFVVEPGERSKSLSKVEEVADWLVEAGASRSSQIVAFGGGVVGDLAGFVAASYMRGVRCMQVPTSLLAMVDSSVGGKVGVNLNQGKNLVGAFWPPSEVRICLSSLDTLPERQFVNGVAEVVKYGAIADPALLERLTRERLKASDSDVEEIVLKCLEIKRRIVEADELETTGLRAQLNFGHTVGHALEALGGYGDLLHGEAIAIGMLLEARIGHRIGVTGPDVIESIERALRAQGLPTSLPAGFSGDQIVQSMRSDKKRVGSGLAFSLLEGVGVCKLYPGISPEDVEGVMSVA